MPDVLSRIDSAGKQMYIAEMLSQAIVTAQDMPYKQGTEIFGHTYAYRTSIPAGNWRQLNQGVGYSKSTTGKASVGMASLEGYSQVDRMLAEANPDGIDAFRTSEEVSFIEGFGQTWEETLWYGNTNANPAEFIGLSIYYNTGDQSLAQNAQNVIDGLGTGSDNASMWLVGWGERSCYGAYPRGSKAGLVSEDKADTVPAYDNLGNRYEAFTTWFRQQGTIAVEDWREVVRIANLDVTASGLAGPDAADLFLLMSQAIMLPPAAGQGLSGISMTDAPNNATPSTRYVWYMNRTLAFWLTAQSIRDRNVLLDPDASAGRPWTSWRGLPIKISDRLLQTEEAVTGF